MVLNFQGIPQLFKHSKDFGQGLGKERKGNNFVVSKDGSGDFESIQEAIKAADVGATIFIKNGTYNENLPLTIKNDLKIQGESLNTIIYFRMNNTATSIINMNSKSRIIMQDLTISVNNPSDYDQACKLFDVTASTDIILRNITATTGATQIYNSGKGVIQGTTGMARIKILECDFSAFIDDVSYFIYATASATNIEVRSNKLKYNGFGMAITNSIFNNNITTTTMDLVANSTDNKIQHNNIGDELNIASGCLRNTIHGNKCGQIFLVAGANYNAVTGNINDLAISDSGTGNNLSGNVVY
jgi:hypothetical protein